MTPRGAKDAGREFGGLRVSTGVVFARWSHTLSTHTMLRTKWIALGLLVAALAAWPLSPRYGLLGARVAMAEDAEQLAGEEPLDRALRLLSHDAAMGKTSINRRSLAKDPMAWEQEMAILRDSPDEAVSAAARATSAVTAQRAAGREVQRLVDEKNAPIMEQAAAENLMGELMADLVGSRITVEKLDELVRQGALSRGQADQILARESERLARLGRGQMAFFETLTNQVFASQEIKRLNLQADLLEGRVVAEHLLPALRARAGANPPPECELFVGGKNSPSALWPMEGFAYISCRSQADYELTRLTLLVKLDLPLGTRLACAYIPRLPPRGQFRLAPVNYAILFAHAPDAQAEGGGAKSMARYSLWCDQFAVEDREPTPGKSGRLEYALQAVVPGSVYVDRSQLPSSRVPAKSTSVKFTELTPAGDGYEVRAEVTTPDPKNPAQSISGVFTGSVKGVKDQPKNALAVISLRSGAANHELAAYVHEEGNIVLAGLGARSPLNNLVAQEEAQQAQAAKTEFRNLNEPLVEARKLIMNGQRDEAEQRLNDYIATSPGEKWEAEARDILDKMDWLEEQGARLKKAREARKSAPESPVGRPKIGTPPKLGSPPKMKVDDSKGNAKTNKKKPM